MISLLVIIGNQCFVTDFERRYEWPYIRGREYQSLTKYDCESELRFFANDALASITKNQNDTPLMYATVKLRKTPPNPRYLRTFFETDVNYYMTTFRKIAFLQIYAFNLGWKSDQSLLDGKIPWPQFDHAFT